MKANVWHGERYRLSACTIAKNEEENIARSIESYRDFADEIIVVDTGSTDDTVRIAEACGAKVLHFTWCNDFAAAKNYALDAASGDWILFLDADEYFSPDCGKGVRDALDIAEQSGHYAIGCRMVNIDKDTQKDIGEMFQIRLFKKGLRYIGEVHEHLNFRHGMRVMTAGPEWFYLYHTGYSASIAATKNQRNKKLLENLLEKEKGTSEWYALHIYLCDIYHNQGLGKEAREAARVYLEGKDRYHYRMVGLEVKPYLNAITSLEREEASPEEIEEWVCKMECALPGLPDTLFSRARLAIYQRRFLEAKDYLGQALAASETYEGTEFNTLPANKNVYWLLKGWVEEGLLHGAAALECYSNAAHERLTDTAALVRMLSIVKRQDQAAIVEFTEKIFLAMDDEGQKTMLSALMFQYMAQPLVFAYAYMREKNQDSNINAQISAFIQAGKGEYAAASNFFYLHAAGGQNQTSAMRALLCAVLAQDTDALEHAKSLAPLCQQVVLSAADAPVVPSDLSQIVALIVEADRLQGEELSIKLARAAAARLGADFARTLAIRLERSFVFPAALAAVEYAPLTSETLFLRGYYTYRLGRMGEAEDLLRLAKAWGYQPEEVDATLELVAAHLRVYRADKQPDMPAEQARIAARLERGDFPVAQASLAALRELAEPDAQWYSMAAVTFYYMGQDERAALIVQAGLLRFPDNADLLYNAGDIYSRMGLEKRSRAYYEQALGRCGDEALREQIRAALVSAQA